MDEDRLFKALAMHAAVTSPIDGGDAPEDARLYEAIFRAWAFAEDFSPFAGQVQPSVSADLGTIQQHPKA